MGTFNLLMLQNVACPNCRQFQNWTVQFKYGDCWLHKYGLFEELRWDGNDVGVRAAKIVLVEGICEEMCKHCANDEIYARIFIDNNKIVAASLVVKNIIFPISSDGNYMIIN
ncbi:hypothetical protein DVR12_17795 [Chitinophaga silvatica]|uniref:Uncharacterized protein n=1 Tax=Chitinophaga silvatica TaxID=2282649 RepID=A0A3E1Y7Y0_9BACT|nr:hypothetical protein [Chitinophaga silvatica]RFS21187.1 hypothetical protein DVR12_17795 [Chitinophaga silvatica]